jgi:hypothetical protein
MSETRTIDMLFLELSQFTNATTAKELALKSELSVVNDELSKFRAAFNKHTFEHAETARRLHEMTAARDEACDIADGLYNCDGGDLAPFVRIASLRKVGSQP